LEVSSAEPIEFCKHEHEFTKLEFRTFVSHSTAINVREF